MTNNEHAEDDLEYTVKSDSTPPEEHAKAADAAPPMPAASADKLPVKAHVGTVERIMPIACRTIEEAYRTAEMCCLAGMVPNSYQVKNQQRQIDWPASKARMAVAIMAGSEVGFGPAASLKNIYVINGRL